MGIASAQVRRRDINGFVNGKGTDAANGFGNRFMWICSERNKLLPQGGSPDSNKIEALEKKLACAVKFARKASLIKRSTSAEERWAEIYYALAEEADGLYGALTARAEPQIMRMACIYALLDNTDVVELEHLEAAYAVWKYADASVAYIFGNRLGDSTADPILAALNEKSDAGIPKHTKEGKLDFHALRVTYTTLAIEAGATVKEAQTLLRHSNPQLTMNTYARTREGRLADVTENVGRVVMCGHERASSGHQVAPKEPQKENGGKKSNSVSEDESEDCDPSSMAGRAGILPAICCGRDAHAPL